MGKTYLCGKIGKSVIFDRSKWGPIGGDNEAPTMIRKLAELNPNDTFIIIGRNDLIRAREKYSLPENLFDVYEDASKEDRKDLNYICTRLKDIKIDGCFLLTGPTANCNIPEKSWKRNDLKKGKKEYAKSLETFVNYVAPIYQYLNESNIPWIMIANDPRYISQGNDLMNPPRLILSQYDEKILMQTFDNWEDQNYIKNEVSSVYAGMEKIFLIDQNPRISEKTVKFMVVLNEGNNGVKSRYPELKKYVLDYIDDVEIYGKWDDATIGNDTRFKGPKKFEDLQSILPSVKYTFIIPIKPGWVTAKWVEMISNGIIPFFHPDYDSQGHCNVPLALRVKNPEDLHKKIELLEAHPDTYKKLLEKCMSIITEDDISGKAISNTILSNIIPFNKPGSEFRDTIKKQKNIIDFFK